MTPDTFVEEVISTLKDEWSRSWSWDLAGDYANGFEADLRKALKEALEQGRREYIKSVLLDFHKARLDGAPGYDFFFKLSADLDALTKPNVESTPSQPD